MSEKKISYRIYGYRNIHTNQWYVGKSRTSQSKRAGKEGIGYKRCPYFWDAIQQDGWSNFEYSLLDTAYSQE